MLKTNIHINDFHTSPATSEVTAIISNIRRISDKTIYIDFIYYDDVLNEGRSGPLRLGTSDKQAFILIPTFKLFGYDVTPITLTEQRAKDIENDLVRRRDEFVGCAVILPIKLDEERNFVTAQAPKDIPDVHSRHIDDDIARLEHWVQSSTSD